MVASHSFILKAMIILGLAEPIDRQDSRHKHLLVFLEKMRIDKKIPILDIGIGLSFFQKIVYLNSKRYFS
jgi:hypothetical protein